MTTPKPKIHPAPDYWEPFPDHERVHKDMLQSPTINDLRERLHMILAPGAHFPWHPTNLVSDEVPVYYANTDPATGRTPYVVPTRSLCWALTLRQFGIGTGMTCGRLVSRRIS